MNATFTGVHDHDDRLPDWSPEGLAAAVDEMRALRASLEGAAVAGSSLRDVATRDRELAISFLDVQIAEAREPPLPARQSVARARRGGIRRDRR